MLHLHYFPGNASLAPHILLEEVGASYVLEHVDRQNQAQKSPAYLALNPNGLIPVLVDDASGLVLYEAAAICLHLADTHPEAGLMPPLGTDARAHAYKWLAWLTNTLQATLIVYFYPERWADDEAAISQVRAHAETRINGLVDQIEAEFARHGGPWLLGESFSALDPYALMLCRWTRGLTRPARSLPAVKTYLDRMLARPAVQRAFSQEGLTAPLV